MAASTSDIIRWFDKGVEQGDSFMIIVTDTYDYEDYPVFCTLGDFDKKHAEFTDAPMQTIQEVYDLSMNRDIQMNGLRRTFNYPAGWDNL